MNCKFRTPTACRHRQAIADCGIPLTLTCPQGKRKDKGGKLLSKKVGEKAYPPPDIRFDLYLRFSHDLSF